MTEKTKQRIDEHLYLTTSTEAGIAVISIEDDSNILVAQQIPMSRSEAVTLARAILAWADEGHPRVRAHVLTDTEYRHADAFKLDSTIRLLYRSTDYTHVDLYSPDEVFLRRLELCPEPK